MGITTREALMRAWVDGWSRGVDGLTTDEAKSAIADKLMLELVGPVDAHYTSATLTAEVVLLRTEIRRLLALIAGHDCTYKSGHPAQGARPCPLCIEAAEAVGRE